MSNPSFTEAPAGSGGGLPAPPARSACITVTERCGDMVTVSTWETCAGVGAFVTSLLGAPTRTINVSAVQVGSSGDL